MAKIKNIRQDHTLPVLGGRFVMKTWRGKLIMQAWPKKRQRPLPPHTRGQNQRFANANVLAKYAPPDQQKIALNLAKEGPLYPRDYLTASMTSGLFIYQLGKNHKVYPMSVRNEVSAELDIIAQQPSSLMGRGPDWWVPVGPGGLYQVPAILTEGEAPVMVSPGPELGGHVITSILGSGVNTGAQASQGWYGTLDFPILLKGFFPYFDSVFAGTYKCSAWTWDGTKLLIKQAETAVTQFSITGTIRRYMPCLTEVILPAGNNYVFIITRTDATDATNVATWFSTNNYQLTCPTKEGQGWVAFAKKDPQPNDVVTFNGTPHPFSVDLLYRM